MVHDTWRKTGRTGSLDGGEVAKMDGDVARVGEGGLVEEHHAYDGDEECDLTQAGDPGGGGREAH